MDPATLTAEGWTMLQVGGFTHVAGPYWERGTGSDREVGLIADERHCNTHLNTVHGGVLMTFADASLGLGVLDAVGHTRITTVQLELHFVSAGKVGEFFICRPELVRATRQLAFMRGLITVDDKIVASADAIWKILDER